LRRFAFKIIEVFSSPSKRVFLPLASAHAYALPLKEGDRDEATFPPLEGAWGRN